LILSKNKKERLQILTFKITIVVIGSKCHSPPAMMLDDKGIRVAQALVDARRERDGQVTHDEHSRKLDVARQRGLEDVHGCLQQVVRQRLFFFKSVTKEINLNVLTRPTILKVNDSRDVSTPTSENDLDSNTTVL
jgi:hypothetical protein